MLYDLFSVFAAVICCCCVCARCSFRDCFVLNVAVDEDVVVGCCCCYCCYWLLFMFLLPM